MSRSILVVLCQAFYNTIHNFRVPRNYSEFTYFEADQHKSQASPSHAQPCPGSDSTRHWSADQNPADPTIWQKIRIRSDCSHCLTHTQPQIRHTTTQAKTGTIKFLLESWYLRSASISHLLLSFLSADLPTSEPAFVTTIYRPWQILAEKQAETELRQPHSHWLNLNYFF